MHEKTLNLKYAKKQVIMKSSTELRIIVSSLVIDPLSFVFGLFVVVRDRGDDYSFKKMMKTKLQTDRQTGWLRG
jgi:hypothetical protein